VNAPLDALDMDDVYAILAEQCRRGIAINAEEQGEIVDTTVLHAADMQFLGQTHLIRVPLPGPRPARAELQTLFEAAYFERFRVELPEIRAVLVNLLTSVIGKRHAFDLTCLIEAKSARARREDAVIAEREMFADDRWQRIEVYERSALPVQ